MGINCFSRICELVALRSAFRAADASNEKLICINRSLRRLLFGHGVSAFADDSGNDRVDKLLAYLDAHIDSILDDRCVALLNKWYSLRICNWSPGH